MSLLSEFARRSDKARCAIAVVFLAFSTLTACGTSKTQPDPKPTSQPASAGDPADITPLADGLADESNERVPNVSKEACALEAHWPMFQGDPGRSGDSAAPAIHSPKVAWSARVGVQSWNNNPIVVGDMVVVGSSGDVWNKPDKADGVYALNAATGELVWFKAFDGDVNGVAFAGCRIVAGSDDGTVRGLDPITGDQAWLQDFRSKVYGQPLPIPGGVMITTGNSGVHKIDAVSGEVIWSAPTGEIRQGAAWDNTSVWVATTGGKMIRFSADGKLQWSGDIPGGWGVWGAPTVVDDGVVAGFVRDTTYGKPGLVGFRLSGALLWEKLNRGTRSNWANVRTSPAFVDGRLYHAEAYSNELVVTELAAATVMKSVALGDCMFPQWSSPVANAEEVIVARHDGGLYAVDRRDQQPRWGIYLGNQQSAGPVANDDLKHPDSRSCSWKPASHSLLATPAVGPDGAIYVGSEEGWLFRVDAE